MLFPPLLVPPKSGRFDTWYCVFAFIACGPCACAGVKAAPQQATARIIKRPWLVVLVMCCAVIFFSLLNFHDSTLGTGRESPPEPLRRFGTVQLIRWSPTSSAAAAEGWRISA